MQLWNVTNEHLARLSDREAVELFADLLSVEAEHKGVPRANITISANTSVADGGIDATVVNPGTATGDDLIRNGYSAYQIKTGAQFKPWQPAQIRSELVQPARADQPDCLKSAVLRCLEQAGEYIVVCFGHDPTPEQRAKAESHIKEIFSEFGHADSRVQVWGQRQILGFLHRYPSIRLRILDIDDQGFQTHSSWARNADMRLGLQTNEDFDRKSDAVGEQLAHLSPSVKHYRVIGPAGSGKTRFVLEALRREGVAARVLYTADAAKFASSQLLARLLRNDNSENAIIVVDECDHRTAIELWNRLSGTTGRLTLVTIFNEPAILSNVELVEPPTLAGDAISKIIGSYGVDEFSIPRYADLAGNSPRFAHLLGQNLREYPHDVLREVDQVYDRFVAGRLDPRSDAVRSRKLVLSHIALFTRVGCAHPDEAELQAVLELLQLQSPRFTTVEFLEAVAELQKLRILQGTRFVYISPKALHIWFWRSWWNTYGELYRIDDLVRRIPASLRGGFYGMFRYSEHSKEASDVVEQLLAADGPFASGDSLRSELGSEVFFSLGEARPDLALGILENSIGRWSRQELLDFKTGRRRVIDVLERAVVWRKHFQRAARLLLTLGEAENESWANNASGLFAHIFTTAMGPVGYTEASPAERLPVLVDAFRSDSKARRLLGLRAAECALDDSGGFRAIGPEHQGLKAPPDFWVAKTWGDLFDAYRAVWKLLSDDLESIPAGERQRRIGIMIDAAVRLSAFGNLADMLIRTFRELARLEDIDRQQLIRGVARVLRFEGKRMPAEARQVWDDLRIELEGVGYAARMQRHVGMDISEDRFDANGDRSELIAQKIRDLVRESLDEPDLLKAELHWLVTNQAARGMLFGFELSKADFEKSWLPPILNSLRQAGDRGSAFFLSGYLRGIQAKDAEHWESILDVLSDDELLFRFIPEITWRCKLTERAGSRILTVSKRLENPTKAFSHFTLGHDTSVLTEPLFLQWIDALSERPEDEALWVRTELLHTYYLHPKPARRMDEPRVGDVLRDPRWLASHDSIGRNSLSEFGWDELGLAYVAQFPDESISLARALLTEILTNQNRWPAGLRVGHLLVQIANSRPLAFWSILAEIMEGANELSWYEAERLLQGRHGDGLLASLPADPIWQWVEVDVDRRAGFIARCVSPHLAAIEGRCTAREVLKRYGDRKNVRSALYANFQTGTWWGELSDHLKQERNGLIATLAHEAEPRVRSWIEDYVTSLDQQIRTAEIDEEREAR